MANQIKQQSSASLAFVKVIHRWPKNSPQRASNAENVSIWWRHHANGAVQTWLTVFVLFKFYRCLFNDTYYFYHTCICSVWWAFYNPSTPQWLHFAMLKFWINYFISWVSDYIISVTFINIKRWVVLFPTSAGYQFQCSAIHLDDLMYFRGVIFLENERKICQWWG